MFKLLKNLFDSEKEVDNNLFFDEISTGITENPVEQSNHYDIPIETLAKVILTSDTFRSYVSENSSYAKILVDQDENTYTSIMIDISTLYDQSYGNEVTMYVIDKDKSTLSKGTRICDKKFYLTNAEAIYLSKLIKERHNADKKKKQQSARQEIEDALQSILSK